MPSDHSWLGVSAAQPFRVRRALSDGHEKIEIFAFLKSGDKDLDILLKQYFSNYNIYTHLHPLMIVKNL